MTAAKFSSITALVDDLEDQLGSLDAVPCTNNEVAHLNGLSERLQKLGSILLDKVASTKYNSRIWEAGVALRLEMLLATSKVIFTQEVCRLEAFTQSIEVILDPSKGTVKDFGLSRATRKYQERCKQIRGLSPDGIVSLALTFRPIQWAAHRMSINLFNCFLDTIEPDQGQ